MFLKRRMHNESTGPRTLTRSLNHSLSLKKKKVDRFNFSYSVDWKQLKVEKKLKSNSEQRNDYDS